MQVYLEENRYLCARNDSIDVRFDKATGKMTRLRLMGQEILHGLGGPTFNGYRYISNDGTRYVIDGRDESVEQRTRVVGFEYSEIEGVLQVKTFLEATVGATVVPYAIVYDIHPEGYVDVDAHFTAGPEFRLPRIGLQLLLDPAFEQVTWYGRGPMENYQDRKDAAFLGLYRSTVTGMEEPYVRAQTMGERTDTRWVDFTTAGGCTVRFRAEDTFDFSALHFTELDLYRVKYGNDLDLVRRNEG